MALGVVIGGLQPGRFAGTSWLAAAAGACNAGSLTKTVPVTIGTTHLRITLESETEKGTGIEKEKGTEIEKEK
jgi:hypothetical protein